MEKVLVSPQELARMMDSEPLVVIDTRDPDTYAKGHLPGAVNLRDIFTYLATSTPEGLEELRSLFAKEFGEAGLSGKETAVFYEDTMANGYGQSCRGYFLLSWLGYSKAKILHGGYHAWVEAGLPTTTAPRTPTPATFVADAPKPSMMLDKHDMLKALSNPDVVKLDVRDVDEWIGTSSSPYGPDFAPRKGRLPGAVWIEWYRFMKPGEAGPVFKTAAEIRAECQTAGISPDDKVYLYCFKGARASNTFVALKEAGFQDVHMYFGSWNEWSRDSSLPIEEGFPKPALREALAA
jgi:thiosulfate/3-mercaptopyruvate sulfurtransferase